MRTHEFILRVRISRTALRGLLMAAFLVGTAGSLNPGQNTLKWTTYYSSPKGIFTNLVSNGAVGLGGNVTLGGDQGCGGFSPTSQPRYTPIPPADCAGGAPPRVVRIDTNKLRDGILMVPSTSGNRLRPILFIRGDVWADRLLWSDTVSAMKPEGITQWPIELDNTFVVEGCNQANCRITKGTTLKLKWSVTEAIALRTRNVAEKDPITGKTKIYNVYGARFVTRIKHATGGGFFVDIKPTWKILQPDTGDLWPKWPPVTVSDPNGKMTGYCTYTPVVGADPKKRAGSDLNGYCEIKFPVPNNYKPLAIEIR